VSTFATLPDPTRFFEIRFESIGGLGAHAAGQILARTAVLRLGLNGAHFSSYGSEKKGSVVRSYIRLAAPEMPIRSSAPIDSPDLLVVFHSALLQQSITLAGLKATGILILNGATGVVPGALERVPQGVQVLVVDAQQIALEEGSRPNAVLLGALTAAVPFLDAEAVLAGLNAGFAHKSPEAVAANARAFQRGATAFERYQHESSSRGDLPIERPDPAWGYATAPLGGVIPMAGNTVWNDLSASRTGWVPVFHPDECIHCGLCALVCPDYCLSWSDAIPANVDTEVSPGPWMQGVDYRYCKGCLRCIETCTTEALTREVEAPGMADRLSVPLFPGYDLRDRSQHGD
jgi:pyruvate ferredoxin oxidoreductase gamma subunit